ncbi:muconate cycloisomerase [Thermocatellispora tengchongensis]|uniref:Muconate cycloisomerase n=1 Tax=Thermocatellispora tengchongensis TaxID=1073253 RepID=A0A840P3J6_9ACTN|nr:mandelate racemase/muconate lactonizing enzyme family protein [Thermocatellispora tengchongensis]MBB5133559.1 muconate cycloisomerase [Thermocatellispora tengchongensis]
MRIARLEAVPVSVPLHEPFTSALGVQATSDYGIVIAEADDGTIGLGEISLIWHGSGASLCDTVNGLLAPAVVGADPFGTTRFQETAARLLAFGRHSLAAVAAVETAMLDLAGKAAGRPVYDLLGGRARERVPLSMSLPIAPVEEVLDRARRLVGEGFTTLKVKGGGDHERLVEAVARLRAEFGDGLGIRVDLNMACRPAKEALRLVRRLEPYGVLSVEQPLPADDVDGMAELRAASGLPIMADESVWSAADAWRVLRAGAADIVNVYVPEAGGPVQARRIADMCAAAGAGVAVGSMPELGIGTAAAAHVAFSSPRLDQPSDVAGHLYHAGDVVRTGLEVRDGFLLPPTGPGLGVELDHDALAEYRTDTPGRGVRGAYRSEAADRRTARPAAPAP